MSDHHVAYPPLNVPKPVADGVWVVDASPIRAEGVLTLPLRMTVIRLADGGLVLYSPTRYRETLRTAIERLGPIRHLVAPSIGHWMFVGEWQRRCPEAKTWGVPQLAERAQVRNSGLRFDAMLGAEAPSAWAGEIEHVLFEAPGFGEVDFFHTPSRTLIVADTVLAVERSRLPPLSRLMAVAAGICTPSGKAPAQLRALCLLNRRANAAAAARMIGLAPERIVVAHGTIVEANAEATLRRSLAWLRTDPTLLIAGAAGAAALAVTAGILASRRPRRPSHRLHRR